MAEKHEIRVTGRAVSRGIGVGRAICLFGNKKQFYRRDVPASEVEFEIARYIKAVDQARNSLAVEIERAGPGSGSPVEALLESHLLILDDPQFVSKIRNSISSELVNTEWAIQNAVNEYTSHFKNNSDQHLREKYLDLEDVAERLLAAVAGDSDEVRFERGSVIAASELRASTILRFHEDGIAGIVTEHGGWTSHASIIAREFEIPSVTGIPHLFRNVFNGLSVAIDGFRGEVIFDPARATLDEIKVRSEERSDVGAEKSTSNIGNTNTLDGRSITVRTNTGSVESYEIAKERGAKGIGLYRSEGLIGKFGRIPTEDEQAEEYRHIALVTNNDGVRVRTFDIDSDLYVDTAFGRQRNPALGLRAIRLGFHKSEILIPQLRALLRASHETNISVVVPMITGAAEIVSVREIIKEQSQELKRAGTPVGNPTVGAMIEIPSAAILADQLASVSDFLCLGTNDLAQYVLAADRDNESVSEWFRTLHPAMLRLVRSVIEACKSVKKQLIVCGEMAGSPFYVPVLIGMGADDLSIGPKSIDAVRRVIAGIAFEEAANLVRNISGFSTADEVERFVAENAKQNWPHLYPSGFFEQNAR